VDWSFLAMPIRGLKRSLHRSYSNEAAKAVPFQRATELRSSTGCHLAKVSLEGLLNPQNCQREREREM
jgi:hypothetical protein